MIPQEQEWANKKYTLHKIYPHSVENQREQTGMMFHDKTQLEESGGETHYIYEPDTLTYALYRRID